jgi:hypothetical protein
VSEPKTGYTAEQQIEAVRMMCVGVGVEEQDSVPAMVLELAGQVAILHGHVDNLVDLTEARDSEEERLKRRINELEQQVRDERIMSKRSEDVQRQLAYQAEANPSIGRTVDPDAVVAEFERLKDERPELVAVMLPRWLVEDGKDGRVPANHRGGGLIYVTACAAALRQGQNDRTTGSTFPTKESCE